jgi:myosin-1
LYSSKKALYEKLFSFIFARINEILDIKKTVNQNEFGSKNKVIGVLDIYGFEIFEHNGFNIIIIIIIMIIYIFIFI